MQVEAIGPQTAKSAAFCDLSGKDKLDSADD
jgi:hypothetical protein